MSSPKHIVSVSAICILICLMPENGISCGPFFPEMLLAARQQTLQASPPTYFNKLLKKLLPSGNFNDLVLRETPVISNNYYNADQNTLSPLVQERLDAETANLTEQQSLILKSMRQQVEGDLAYALGASLPEDIRLYTAAAVDFNRALQKDIGELVTPKILPQHLTSDQKKVYLDNAQQRFWAMIRLSDSANNQNLEWAYYMLQCISSLRFGDGNHYLKTYQRLFADLTEQQIATINNVSQLADGDQVYALTEGLAENIRLYLAGVADFNHAIQDDDLRIHIQLTPETFILTEQLQFKLSQAQQRLTALLALDQSKNQQRAVWATYLLARIAALQDNRDSADHYFLKTRELVKNAAYPDPLGLSVASFGEQAKLHIRPGEIKQAIALYLQQYAYGSQHAENSLKFLAEKIIADDALLDEVLLDSQGQDLIFAYFFSRDQGYLFDGDQNNGYSLENKLWQHIVAIINKQGIESLHGTDMLAGLAYERHDYDLAGRLVAKSESSLGYWLKAKLALRTGDQQAALAAYAQTVQAFPKAEQLPAHTIQGYCDDDTCNHGFEPVYLVYAEQGVLRLSRGEFLQAMTFFYQAAGRYWRDAAYLAEQVLTVDELKTFVDTQVPAPSEAELQATQAADFTTDKGYTKGFSTAIALRDLLARRLVRAGREPEAFAYFDWAKSKQAAEQYYTNKLTAQGGWWQNDIDKAQAWYQAARIARFQGMEIMGYELEPDCSVWGGSFPDCMVDEVNESENIASGLISKEEQQRVAKSNSKDHVRFHYRLLAAEQANNAADLLPHSSQAFAAVLCHASQWLLAREPALAAPYYQRYLKQGSYVSWGQSFGVDCPEPDFNRAKDTLWHERLAWLDKPKHLFDRLKAKLF